MKRVIAVSLVGIIAGILVAGCAGSQGPQTIKVGYLANVTGDGAVWGQAEVNGAKLAVEEINKAGGVLGKQLELIVGDARGNATDGVNAVKKLIEQDKVVAILGSNYSGINIACAPIVEAAKVPQIGSFSTNPKVTVDEKGNVRPYSFRLCFIDPYQGKVIADYLYSKVGKKRAAILYDVTSDYSVGLAEYFEQRFKQIGGEVVAKLAFKSGDVDFRPQLSEIKQKNPDAIVLPILYKEIALAAKQTRELGMNDVVFMGGDGYSLAMLEMAGKELQGSYWVSHFSWEDPKLKTLLDKYVAKYNEKNPETNAAMGYDMVYFLVDCIKRAGKAEGPAIRNAIENAKDVKLQHATITMDPKTHNPLNKPAAILKVEGDKIKFIEMFSPQG
ncbi:MAG: ABC transporter substrate-binding protein [Bacillota bacterium]